ncbi:branched-chain amino acid transporter permease [Treponema sp.]|uniref:branched-chain amino acid transporter permease n=1 Tax=Treponema sp. TaxID=166 RepID=UPI003F077B36
MKSPYTLAMALVAVFVSGAIIYGTRLLPFVAFSRRKPPAVIRFIEKYTPSLIMAVLAVYCFKDTVFLQRPFGIPHLAASLSTVVLHLAFRNAMVSIFFSTALFMVLSCVI